MPARTHTRSARAPTRRRAGAWLACAVLVALTGTARAVDLPGGLAVEGKEGVLTLHAEGVQIYRCETGVDGKAAWKFREPLATLLRDDATVGRHFAGPMWELSDGSAVGAKMAAQAPGRTAADIPWLRLDVTSRRGAGTLAKVTAVQRLNTRGGAFAGPCAQAGAFHLEPYSAGYVFFEG